MKCPKDCVYCSPTREQWHVNWKNRNFPNEYFAHRGTSVTRTNLIAVASGLAAGTNEEDGSLLSEKLKAMGWLK